MFNARRMLKLFSSMICLAVAGCLLVGCQDQGRAYRTGENRLEITLGESDFEEYSGGTDLEIRHWVSIGKWERLGESQPFHLRISFINADTGERVERHYYDIDKEIIDVRELEFEGYYGTIDMKVDGELADLHITNPLRMHERPKLKNGETAYGQVKITIDQEQFGRVKKAFGEGPSVLMLISFAIGNVGVDELVEYADCGVQFSLAQVEELVRYRYSAGDVKKLIAAGYDFKAGDYVKFARYYVSSEYAVGWKKNGYDLDADGLVYAKRHYLKSAMAKGWRDAGYELSLEKVYWVKQRYLKTESAVAWRKAGYELSLDDLYWVKQRYLKPDVAMAWKDAGYDLSLEELYRVKQRYLKPDKAKAWKAADYELDLEQLYWVKQRYIEPKAVLEWRKAGYDFSLDELYKLKNAYVDAKYGAAFVSDDYELPSADELIEFKRSRVSAETVKKLRKRKNNYDQSLLLKHLKSNSRNAISEAMMYLSKKRFKDGVIEPEGNKTIDEIMVELMESPETLESLKDRSKDYLNWLKGQSKEDLARWIEEYPGYLETRSPYFSD